MTGVDPEVRFNSTTFPEWNFTDKNLTFMAWVKMNNEPSGSFFIFAGDWKDPTNDLAFIVGGNPNPFAGEFFYKDAGNYVPAGHVLTADTWYHLAFAFDLDTREIEYYVNGTLINSTILESVTAGVADLKYMFVDGRDGEGYPFDGFVDEFYIFNQTLNSTEINYYMNNQSYNESSPSGSEFNITSVTPSNQSFIKPNSQISVVTSTEANCKINLSDFDFDTQGSILTTGNNLTHTYTISEQLNTNNTYYIKCSNGTNILNESRFLRIRGWNNTFNGMGNSVMKANSYIATSDRMTYLVAENLTGTYDFFGISEDNQGVGSSCITNHSGCDERPSPAIETYETRIIDRNPRILIWMANVNDNLGGTGVPKSIYNSQFRQIMADVENRTNITTYILTSPATGNPEHGSYSLVNQSNYDNFMQVFREYAIEKQYIFIDMYKILNFNSSLYVDQIHMNEEGSEIFSEYVLDALNNPSKYIMTYDNFDYYSVTNQSNEIANYTFFAESANSTKDSVVDLMNITPNGMHINNLDVNLTIIYPNGTFEDGTNYIINTSSRKFVKTSDSFGGVIINFTSEDEGKVNYLSVQTTDFSGDTTDLSLVNISNISNLILDQPNCGKINFSAIIDLSSGGDINSYVNISQNRIEINSSALSSLNKSARLSLYNLSFTNPRILRDGVVCSGCTEVSYDSVTGIFIFDVTSFSVYSLEETPVAEETTSSSSSGSVTYRPTVVQLEKGYKKTLRKNQKMSFVVGGETHKLKLDGVTDEIATITVSSEPVTFNLSINETKKLDLDSDGFYDLEVFLKDITGLFYWKKVDLAVKVINEEIVFEEDVVVEEVVDKVVEEVEIVEEKSYLWVWGVLGVLVLGIWIGTWIFGKGKLRRRKRRATKF